MAFNFGTLGQVLTPAFAGRAKGQAIAESEAYKRQQEAEERDRQIRETALREQLLRAADDRDQRRLELDEERTQFQKFKDLPTLYAPTEATGEATYVEPGEQPEWRKQGYPDFKTWRADQNRGRGGDRRPKWQQEGYPDFQSWREDQRTGKVSATDPAKERRAYILKRVPDLRKSRTEYDPQTGIPTTVPGLSAKEAYRAAAEEYDTPETGNASAGDADTRVRDYIRRLGGVQSDGGMRTGSPTQAEASPAPRPRAATMPASGGDPRADRWEELVNQGVPEDEATRQVLMEFGQ